MKLEFIRFFYDSWKSWAYHKSAMLSDMRKSLALQGLRKRVARVKRSFALPSSMLCTQHNLLANISYSC